MHPAVWEASGHVDNFHDPLVDNKESKKRYRLDHLLELQESAVVDTLLGLIDDKITKKLDNDEEKIAMNQSGTRITAEDINAYNRYQHLLRIHNSTDKEPLKRFLHSFRTN